MTRRIKPSRQKKRRSRVRGAGYMTGPQSAYVGGLEYNSYSGPQTNFSPMKDCTGNPMSHRTGWISPGSDMSVRVGLPGMAGGKHGRKRGGAAMPPPTPYMADFGQTRAPPINGSLTAPPSYVYPRTSEGAPAVAPEVVASRPGNPSPPHAMMPGGASSQLVPNQKGGALFGFNPGFGPLNAESGIGTSPAPFGRLPCETGTYNPLNRNPGNVQGLTTASPTPPYVTMSPMNTMRGMRGGDMNLAGAPIQLGSGADFSRANFPMVSVGQADSMRYYAPTAGYGHDFQTFKAPSPVPALMLNTGYDARAFNPACIKTGGRSRKNGKNKRRFRGGDPVALNASSFRSLQPGEAETRRDFDGSSKALPCQAAGSRRKKRSTRSRRTRRTCSSRRRAHRK